MRIDAINKVSQLYQTSGANKTTKSDKANTCDKYEMSEVGKNYQLAKQAVANKPDVREEMVNDFKNRIATGTYSFDSEVVADMVVERYFDTKA